MCWCSDLGGMQMHPELQDAVLKMYHEPLPGMGAPYDPLGNARPKTRNEKKALPAHATMFLKQWWHDHYAWPYPTVRCKLPPSNARRLKLL